MKKSKWDSTISNAYTAPGRMVRRSDVDVLHCGVLYDLIYILRSIYIINREKERSRESVRELQNEMTWAATYFRLDSHPSIHFPCSVNSSSLHSGSSYLQH